MLSAEEIAQREKNMARRREVLEARVAERNAAFRQRLEARLKRA